MKIIRGFTLVELLVVVMIIAIFAAIAIPSYAQYMQRRDLAIARQEALRIAAELERFKSKNFSYKGFDATFIYPDYKNATGQLYLPIGSTQTNAKYLLTLVDRDVNAPLTVSLDSGGAEGSASKSVLGLGWRMKVERMNLTQQASNYDLLIRSDGLRCMTKTANIITTYSGCGTDGELW